MKRTDQIPSSEITPPSVYFNRRAFMKGGIAAASLVTTGGSTAGSIGRVRRRSTRLRWWA